MTRPTCRHCGVLLLDDELDGWAQMCADCASVGGDPDMSVLGRMRAEQPWRFAGEPDVRSMAEREADRIAGRNP